MYLRGYTMTMYPIEEPDFERAKKIAKGLDLKTNMSRNDVMEILDYKGSILAIGKHDSEKGSEVYVFEGGTDLLKDMEIIFPPLKAV